MKSLLNLTMTAIHETTEQSIMFVFIIFIVAMFIAIALKYSIASVLLFTYGR